MEQFCNKSFQDKATRIGPPQTFHLARLGLNLQARSHRTRRIRCATHGWEESTLIVMGLMGSNRKSSGEITNSRDPGSAGQRRCTASPAAGLTTSSPTFISIFMLRKDATTTTQQLSSRRLFADLFVPAVRDGYTPSTRTRTVSDL